MSLSCAFLNILKGVSVDLSCTELQPLSHEKQDVNAEFRLSIFQGIC